MKKVLLIILLLLVVLGIAAGVGVWKVRHLADSKLLIKEETIFTLKPGTGRLALGEQLYADKIINRPRVFQWLLRIEPDLSHFKAGTYRFTPQMTVREMLKLLESGKEAQFPLRLVEGMRLSDYLKQLREAPYIKHTLSDDKYATVAQALELENPEWIEGWFWPDTWMYTANTTDVALLKRAHKKMVKAVDSAWEGRADGLPYKDKNQLVTMASIIEKETAVASERDQVASVFINRLRIGMRLQTDPTVIYGMGERYNGKLSRADLETPTAYNTYTITGLPPGAIATPGADSLKAAAHPAKTPYLYFVADGKGGHTFNTNLASHNKSVQDYLQKIRTASADSQDLFPFKPKKGQVVYLSLPEVLYFSSDRRCVTAHTLHGSYEGYYQLSKLMEDLPQYFYQCYKSYAINLHYVQRIDTKEVHIHEEIIPISAYGHRSVAENRAELVQRKSELYQS